MLFSSSHQENRAVRGERDTVCASYGTSASTGKHGTPFADPLLRESPCERLRNRESAWLLSHPDMASTTAIGLP
jgi:hypothetical protein